MNYNFDDLKPGIKELYDQAEVRPECEAEASREAERIIQLGKATYQIIEAKTGVPWFVVGIIHTREAGSADVGAFKCVLHNGERIIGTGRKTSLVPAGRGPFDNFTSAAVDALEIDHLNQISWQDGWGPEHVAFALEAFNGFGYRGHGIPSPYVWGSTTVQKRGKYVSDGVYDPSVMDPQTGGMAILWELMKLDQTVRFLNVPVNQGLAEKPLQPVLANQGSSATPSPLQPTDDQRSPKAGTLEEIAGWFGVHN